MKLTKRLTALVGAVAVFSSITASAAWEFAGYDTTTPPQYGKIYNEVIGGKYTSKTKLEALSADDVSWKFEGYELQYPHAGYERLYLEGNAQKNITRTTNLFPQWETRFKDFMWDIAKDETGGHLIYQRQQTMINNKYWAWDFGRDTYEDNMVFVPTTRHADVTEEYRNYGIANLDLNGKYVFDVNGKVYNQDKMDVYNEFGTPDAFPVKLDAEGNPTKEIVEDSFLHNSNLSLLDENGEYVYSDADIAWKLTYDMNLPLMQTLYLTGPAYHGENATKDLAATYLANPSWNWYNADGSQIAVVNKALPSISWTNAIYENAEPYNYYQYLIINGVIMDGRNDTPKIWRYTGGKADPYVEWRYAFPEEEYPFNVVEQKYIKGNDGKMIPGLDAFDNYCYRIPTGKMGNEFIKVTDTEIQFYIRDEKGDHLLSTKTINRVDSDFGGGFAGYVGASGYVTK